MGRKIDYSDDGSPDGFVRMESFQALADEHLASMVQRTKEDPLTVFASNAVTIYRNMKPEAQDAKIAVVKMARANRLSQLMDMMQKSNIMDFILIKWPAWWANDKIERRKERRMTNV